MGRPESIPLRSRCGGDALGCERCAPQTSTRRAKYRIRDGRWRRADARLARSERRRARSIYEDALDLRHVREAEDGIRLPIDAPDPGRVEAHLLEESPARRLYEAALELVRNPLWVDDLSDVCSDYASLQVDDSGCLDLELYADGAVRLGPGVARVSDPYTAATLARAGARPIASAAASSTARPRGSSR